MGLALLTWSGQQTNEFGDVCGGSDILDTVLVPLIYLVLFFS